MEEALIMSKKDINRHHVIRNVLEKRCTQTKAALILGLGLRQIKRLCKQVRKEGARGLIHKLRGQPSNHQLDIAILERAANIVQDPLWRGFGPTFSMDKLQELHDIALSDWSVRRLMTKVGVWQPRRRKARHRAWRERRLCLGMLSQLDGSTHDWFEGRGPVCVLLLYIDDATSRILYAEFVEVEDTFTLMRVTWTYLKLWGRPIAFYVDRDSIYKVNRQATFEEELRDEQPMPQFTRAMHELGVGVITANSPQAKGRVERSFDTHQDRLVKELRLQGIATIPEANRYLWDTYIPKHNARYAVVAARSTDAHRPVLASHDLAAILAFHSRRVIQQDFIVQYCNRFFQLLPEQPVLVRPRSNVTVQERLDGSVHLVAQERYLAFKTTERRPHRPFHAVRKAAPVAEPILPRRKHRTHPWRTFRTPARPSHPVASGPCYAATMGD